MENRDSFGLDAAAYRRFRPRYPAELFRFLAGIAPDREYALDCGTGNGQAAVDLAEHFENVAATDFSAAQIADALPHPRVTYTVAPAEDLPFADGTFSLVTAAQAAHWFDLPAFYAEVDRVGKPGCIVAIWGYSYCRVSADIDRIVETILLRPIEPFWAEGNKVISQKYQSIGFPFEELDWPSVSSGNEWTRYGYMQYLRTWSAVKKYVEHNGTDPVAELDRALDAIWPEHDARAVTFDFVGRVGRKP